MSKIGSSEVLDRATSPHRVLITGAAGFVGSHVARKLVSARAEVHAICKPSSDRWRLADCSEGISWHTADISDGSAIEEIFSQVRPEAVLHLGAYGIDYAQQDPHELFNSNVYGTLFIVRMAANFGARRMIHTGSCSEYDSSSLPIPESAPPFPHTLYGVTKAASTMLVIQQGKQLALPVIVLRLFGLYGPFEAKKRFIPTVLLACLNGRPASLTPGQQRRDYTYIEDVAHLYASLALAQSFPQSDVFNIGSGQGHSLKELGSLVERATGRTGMLKWGDLAHRTNEVQCQVADISKAKRELRWLPRTSLEEGLRKTIAYFESEQKRSDI